MTERTVTAGMILAWLDEQAPFCTAEPWDSVGLLVGSGEKPVTRVLTALDITPSVIGQAVSMGAELIISHHPVIFRPLERLDEKEPPCLLLRHGIAAIGVHTNWDKAAGGVNDALAERLGLGQVRTAGDGLCRIGVLPEEREPAAFAALAGQRLGVPSGGVQWMDGGRPVRTVGVCGGAGGEYIQDILPQVDAFVTGELHYHEWPYAANATIIAAGHFYTEVLIAAVLAQKLGQAFPSLTVSAAGEACPYTLG